MVKWNSFDVGSDASVNFQQPGSDSVTLNRVLSSNPSEIFGKITAKGQVFITNPNGVTFGRSSSVEVGGLVATTHHISDADFMAGLTTFSRKGANPHKSRRASLGSVISDLGGGAALA